MSTKHMLAVSAAVLILSGVMLTAQAPAPIASYSFEPADPACQSRTLASAGGLLPKDPHTLVLRWLGFTGYEVVYDGQIILLDAYFDRGYGMGSVGLNGGFAPLGFKAADVKKVNAIFIGHGHFDHMSDAASIGARTGAMVVGGPPTAEKLRTQPIDPKQIREVTGRGGEVFPFKGFKVEAILGRHSENPPDVTSALNTALKAVSQSKPLTPEQAAETDEVLKRGTMDPRVTAEGTIAYLFTFDNGFKLLYKDSSGTITAIEKAAMARVGPVDVAILPLALSLIQSVNIQLAMQYAETFRPTYYLPNHHDSAMDGLWRATEPVFQAVKDADPSIITVSKGYREPTCWDTGRRARR